MEMVDLPRLMELLGYADYAHRLDFSYQGKQAADGSYIVDTDTIKGFWLKDDCDIEKSGIKAKSLEDNLFKQLTDSKQKARSDFEKDIRLDLPCSLDEVKAWAQRNDFGDLLDESELLKGRRMAFEEIRASRTFAKNDNGEPLEAEELLDTPIADLLKKASPTDDYEKFFLLFSWLNLLKTESHKQRGLTVKTPSEDAIRKDTLAKIRRKREEINQHLSVTEAVGNVDVGSQTDESKPWLIYDPKDPEPKHPWYTAARYFARQLVIGDVLLLTKKPLLAQKVVPMLSNAGYKKRGKLARYDPGTVLKAFTNVTLG